MSKHNNTGGLWSNNYKKQGDMRPDFIGEITIGNVTHKIAAWHNTKGVGNKPDLNIVVTEAVATPAKAVDVSQVKTDDLPF